MQQATAYQHTCVAGYVRGKKTTRDGNFVFRIINQWFSLPSGSTFAKKVNKAERALVVFEKTEKKYPKVVSLTPNYTGEDLRDATCS